MITCFSVSLNVKKTSIVSDKLNKRRTFSDSNAIISLLTVVNCYSSSDAIKVMEMRCTYRYIFRLPNVLLLFLIIFGAYRHQLQSITITIWKQFSFSFFHCRHFIVDISTIDKMLSTFCNFPFLQRSIIQ